MAENIHQLWRAYVQRRSPWGPPWWIYGVAYGVLNLVRQAVIVLAAAELSTAARLASWVATALVVIGVVNTTAFVLDRRAERRSPQLVTAREMARRDNGPEEGSSVREPQIRERPVTSTRWAPWWIYLVVIVGANQLRKAVVPEGGSLPALRVAVALAFSAALFVAITHVYRATQRPAQ